MALRRGRRVDKIRTGTGEMVSASSGAVRQAVGFRFQRTRTLPQSFGGVPRRRVVRAQRISIRDDKDAGMVSEMFYRRKFRLPPILSCGAENDLQ